MDELVISLVFLAIGLVIVLVSGPAAEYFGTMERTGDREINLARRSMRMRGLLFTSLGVIGLIRALYGG